MEHTIRTWKYYLKHFQQKTKTDREGFESRGCRTKNMMNKKEKKERKIEWEKEKRERDEELERGKCQHTLIGIVGSC